MCENNNKAPHAMVLLGDYNRTKVPLLKDVTVAMYHSCACDDAGIQISSIFSFNKTRDNHDKGKYPIRKILLLHLYNVFMFKKQINKRKIKE